ncbi:MAG TPA: selenide, water dikinase SelD [Pararobbsia sp.]|nr:selenide, water dikinase SelD [Pararobbsia sp.]
MRMNPLSDSVIPRLTSLAHGGGCGCKIAPGVLANLLKRASPLTRAFPDLLVGTETSDDAAVYRLNDAQAIVATTDFFMPIVDDPFDFGRIAATNALSDVYAMGGTPILALALVGMPINVLSHDVIARILEGGEAVCADAGIPVAGGHSIDSVEPIYGLAALGLVDPARIARNAGARTGDRLILGKRLGVGILSAAFKKHQLDDAGYRALIATTTQLNRPGTAIATLDGVHAMTDVTGFGLLGHTLEMCRGAQRAARLDFSALRWLDGVLEHASAGVVTGASTRNWASYADSVELAASLPDHAQTLLTDPQTSGGLLIACDEACAARVLDLFHDEGFEQAAIVGEIVDGPPHVAVA